MPGYSFRHYDHPSEEEHRTAEQFNWRDSYRLNVGIAVAAALTVLFACGAYLEARRQAAAADGQLQAMHDEQRPWLSFKRRQGGMMGSWPNNADMDFSFVIQIENIGKLPARDVVFTAIIFAAEYNKSSAEDTCKSSNNFFGNKLGVLLPGEVNERDGLIGRVSYKAMEKTALSLSIGHRNRARNLSVVGCATYLYAGDALLHTSGFRADLYSGEGAGPDRGNVGPYLLDVDSVRFGQPKTFGLVENPEYAFAN